MSDFIMDEVRCGYTVPTKLKKIWNIELELLKEILRVCQKYELHPVVYSGTMLGAVRHHGFIPWDDDLDIVLIREDFDKLVHVAEREFTNPIFFQTPLTDRKYFFEYARLRNSETTGMITWNKSVDYNNGIYVDIYPLDGYVDNKLKLGIQLLQKKIVKQFLASYYADDSYKSRKPGWLVGILKRAAHLRPYEEWYILFEKIISRYSETAERLTLLGHEYHIISKYWCNKSDLKDIIWVPFEDINVPVPANYDKMLTNFYGDYMEFPPIEERGTWHKSQIIFEPDIPYTKYFSIMEKSNE